MTGEEGTALLREGEAAHHAGRLDEATELFGRLIEADVLVGWANFFLSRVLREQGRADAARAALDVAVERDPHLFWAHYERMELVGPDGDPHDLAQLAEAMASIRWEALAPLQVDFLQRIAHRVWDSGRAGPAGALLGRLAEYDALGLLGLVRVVEGAADERAVDVAAARLSDRTDLDEIAWRVLANHYALRGDLDGEVRALDARLRLLPRDASVWMALVRAQARAADRDGTAATLAADEAFSGQQRCFARFIAALELGDLDAAFLDFRTYVRLYDDVPKMPGIRLAYLLGDRTDPTRRDEVLALLRSEHDGDVEFALVELNAAMRDQRWDDARAVYNRHFAVLEDKPPAARAARVDMLALSGKLEEALKLLRAERLDDPAQPGFGRSTVRILSELGRWDEAVEAGLQALAADRSFPHFLSPLIRAARKAERTGELLDALLDLPRPLEPTRLEAVGALVEDLAEAGRTDALVRVRDLPLPPERLNRIRLKLARVARPPVTKDLCVFYCADREYLTPALVSLTALATSNAGLMRRADLRLVVDADVVEEAWAGVAPIATRLGVDVAVVDASEVVTSAEGLRTAYGMFTGGQSLSLAAYYRIFYARHLFRTTDHAQALYVDADTLVRGGLAELFETAMTAPLQARPEVDRPEVRRATALHRLGGRYFNSGVLRFDLRHPDLPAVLDRAIEAALDPEATLIFQDQCALNIAFDGRVDELPDRYNYYNPPTADEAAPGALDAVVVHHLDRPKPWDSLYRRPAREWFEWFDLIETLKAERRASEDG
ncbi:MAG TPA: glycosyltransferase [Sphingomonas sp.]|jgi:lipopolysaccharide biosynthesis glycosyltransferase